MNQFNPAAMKTSYRLVIPSRERAKWLMTKSVHTLQSVKHLSPIFMVRTDDSQLQDYINLATIENPITLYEGKNIYGAAQTYDMIINDAVANNVERLIILDDDLSFAMRNPDLNASPMFRLCKPDELSILLEHAASLVCGEMPIMSFTPIMKRSQERILSFCQPMMMAYVFYIPHFAAYPQHRFWMGKRIEARCDLNLTLRLLTQGFLTGYMNTLFIPDNVNNPGGCSTYRFLEVEKASVAYLKETFPLYVTTQPKRGWMGDENVIREAPRIKWRQAFNQAAFKAMFGIEANDFALDAISCYEQTYSSFIKEVRNATQ